MIYVIMRDGIPVGVRRTIAGARRLQAQLAEAYAYTNATIRIRAFPSGAGVWL